MNAESTGMRLFALLDAMPMFFSTPALIVQCGGGLRCPRSTVWESLRRLERDGKVRRTRSAPGGVTRWQSTRWENV